MACKFRFGVVDSGGECCYSCPCGCEYDVPNSGWSATGTAYEFSRVIPHVPLAAYFGGSDATKGTAGELEQSEWDYDSGTQTLTVRLSDNSNPNSKDYGYVTLDRKVSADGTVEWIEHIVGEHDVENADWESTGTDYEFSRIIGTSVSPTTAWFNSVEKTKGSAGSLSAGQWDYNTTTKRLIVRLDDDANPNNKADGWVSIEYDDLITVANLSGPCVTYYVDSTSGGVEETGTGTEEDPWVNLRTVFKDICIYVICAHECPCPKVKVLVKGTIDYLVNGRPYPGRNYNRNLVLEPWGSGRITINIDPTVSVIYATSVRGCVWKKTDVTNASIRSQLFGFRGCEYCIFDDCTSDCGPPTPGGGGFVSWGFFRCFNSMYNNCVGIGSQGFSEYSKYTTRSGSTFNDCSGYSYYFQFGGWTSSGFWWIDGAVFNNCHGTSNGPTSVVQGFNRCNASIFDGCTGDGSGASYVTGFRGCNNGTFNNCDGDGEASIRCWGWSGNTDGWFCNCTQSDNCNWPGGDDISDDC